MIGLDLSTRSIKVAQLSADGQRLLSYCWMHVPPGLVVNGAIQDKVEMQRILAQALAQCRLKQGDRDAVTASIPETKSFLRVVEIPTMEEDEVSEAVQWEVAQHIPFGIENVYVDWQWVSSRKEERKSEQEVLVGAAERTTVDVLYAVLEELRLDVAALELESQAIIRSLISSELRERRGLLIIDLGDATTNVVIHDHGSIRFTASLQKGVQDIVSVLARNETEVLMGPPQQRRVGDREATASKLRAGLEALAVEIHGIVEYYKGLGQANEVKEILLTGGGSNLPGLESAFLSYFTDLHVQRGNPWVNILPAGRRVQPPMELAQSVHFATALGLALRQELV